VEELVTISNCITFCPVLLKMCGASLLGEPDKNLGICHRKLFNTNEHRLTNMKPCLVTDSENCLSALNK
jgi:hypothetical protein